MFKLNKKQSEKFDFKKSLHQYNHKALIEIPELKPIRDFYQERYILFGVGYFLTWYTKNIVAFVKIEPLYIKEKFAKTEITKRFQLQRSISNAYYIGEVNNLNKPHGIGLTISPYYYIEEGHYKNGKRHGKFKIVIE